MFLKISEGIARLPSPWLRISYQDLSVSLRTVVLKLSWAVAPFERLSTLLAPCSSIKIPSFGLCLASARCPQGGGRGLCLRNPNLETRAANVWDLVQSDQQNLATQTGQLSRLVCGHAADTLTTIRTPRRFCEIDQINYETCHSKYSFALSIHSDVRTEP